MPVGDPSTGKSTRKMPIRGITRVATTALIKFVVGGSVLSGVGLLLTHKYKESELASIKEQQRQEFLLKYFDRVVQAEPAMRKSLLRYLRYRGDPLLESWAVKELAILDKAEEDAVALANNRAELAVYTIKTGPLSVEEEKKREGLEQSVRVAKLRLQSIVPAPVERAVDSTPERCAKRTTRPVSPPDVAWKKCQGPPASETTDGVNLYWSEDVKDPTGGIAAVRCTCVLAQ